MVPRVFFKCLLLSFVILHHLSGATVSHSTANDLPLFQAFSLKLVVEEIFGGI